MGGLCLKYVLNAAQRIFPPAQALRSSVTQSMLELLFTYLDHTSPEAVCAMFTTALAFWCQNCLGKLFPKLKSTFDLSLVPTLANLSQSLSLNGS